MTTNVQVENSGSDYAQYAPVPAATSNLRERFAPPRFAANGKELPPTKNNYRSTSILAENVKIPIAWASSASALGDRMTKRKLDLQRKQNDRPHPTFDLDQDGHVSVTDLFLAKRFDKDKDGKLNAEEFAAAQKALASGYKDHFMLGLERSGAIQSAL